MNLLDAIPSIMSAVASVAAAVAAFFSLGVSKKATLIAEQSALAIHHSSATLALTSAVENLEKSTKSFVEFALRTHEEWPREIGTQDHREAGGSNPRPLRHVLANAGEMLARHATRQGAKYAHIQYSMFSIVRDGVNNLNDAEYEDLLRRADGEYWSFERLFGEPPINMHLASAPAFRWAFYQLTRRIDKNNWYEIWEKAWSENGWLNNYQSEHRKIKPVLKATLALLRSEKAKLEHSIFPLKSNPTLCSKYDHLMDVVEMLLDDCSLELVEEYQKLPREYDVIELMIYSIGIAYLVVDASNRICAIRD